MKSFNLFAAALAAVAFACPLAAQTQTNSYPVDPFEKPYTGPTRADVPREITLVRAGMRVQVHSAAFNGYRRTGVLRAASADSVSLRRGDEVVGAATPEVDAIFVSLGRDAGRGAVQGLWMGAAAGLVIGALAGNNGGDEESRSITSIARPENFAIGAAAGALIGGVMGREVWRRAASLTPEQLNRVVREAASGSAAAGVTVAPYASAPLAPGSGTVAGLSIRF